jgi:lipopolysaccharide biosynthesis glycosyltransferase
MSFRTSDFAVALCADRKYFAPAYVACMSLTRDQPARPDVYLLTEAGPHLDRVPHDVPFNILTPDFIGRLPNVPQLWRPLSSFAFLRLFLPDIVPGYRRILYLDCDIRIDGSIAPLFGLDMKSATIAAVADFTEYFKTPIAKWKVKQMGTARLRRSMGLAPDDPFFNSGVLLIDCDRWTRARTTDAAIDCLTRIAPLKSSVQDQDVLNVIFRRTWLPLSPRWNFPSHLFETELEALLRPVIYHNISKPWKFDQANRREAAFFREALLKTPYDDFARRPSFLEVKRYLEKRGKELIQGATFFLPSSQERLQARDPWRLQRELAEYIMANVRSRRFADVDQNISAIDVSALSSLVRA